ncbi:hypothetical protein V2J09_011313 [Rumex salicifolius]
MSEINGTASSSSTSSSLNTSFPDTEDDQTIAQILAEEENLNTNAKLGKRLSHLDSIPHTPRVIENIPTTDDANFDHDGLCARLATYGLAELQIEGDGNCQSIRRISINGSWICYDILQFDPPPRLDMENSLLGFFLYACGHAYLAFRALADQLFRNPDYHKHVRKEVIKQLKHFRKLYEGYVPMKYRRYLRKMKKSGEWGDHVTLQAAADRFQAKICLVTSFRDTCYIEILPRDRDVRVETELWLSFWSEVHYNSLYTAGDVPTRVPKKKHWLSF